MGPVARHEAVFPLHHHAQVLIIQQQHFDGQVLAVTRRKLLNIHQKAAVTIDVDHQANITAVLTRGMPGQNTLTQVLMGEIPVNKAILKTHYERLDLLPADASLADVNVAMADRRENRLMLLNEIRDATRAVADFSKIEG